MARQPRSGPLRRGRPAADREGKPMSFRIFALAGATAVLLAVPLPTEFSAQPSIEVGPGDARVVPEGYDRRDSGRRDERERRDEGEYRDRREHRDEGEYRDRREHRDEGEYRGEASATATVSGERRG
jgi:hypothetical protein